MSTICFRDLESATQTPEGHSALGDWYTSVRCTPISELGVDDLSRACRQELYLEYVVPVALNVLQHDINAGHQYDGELASVLTRLAQSFWKSHVRSAIRAAMILEARQNDLDEDVQKEVQEFLARNDS